MTIMRTGTHDIQKVKEHPDVSEEDYKNYIFDRQPSDMDTSGTTGSFYRITPSIFAIHIAYTKEFIIGPLDELLPIILSEVRIPTIDTHYMARIKQIEENRKAKPKISAAEIEDLLGDL